MGIRHTSHLVKVSQPIFSSCSLPRHPLPFCRSLHWHPSHQTTDSQEWKCPSMVSAIFGKKTSNKTEALVVEDSRVDICARQMETVTRNLNHRKWMVVEERVEYTGIADNQTEISTQATFRCSLKYNLFPLICE